MREIQSAAPGGFKMTGVRARPLLLGLALGGWWSFFLVLWSVAARRSWWWVDIGPEDLYGAEGVTAAIAFFFLGGVGLVLAWVILEEWLRLDVENKASAAWRWALPGLWSWPTTIILGGPALVAFGVIEVEPWIWVLLSVVLWTPFAVLRKEVVSAPTSAGWWRPRWPGVRALAEVALYLLFAGFGVLLAGGLIVSLVIAALETPLPEGSSVGLLLAGGLLLLGVLLLVQFALSALLTLGLAALWIYSPPWRALPGLARDLLRRRVLGPALALEARWCLITLFVAAPVVAGRRWLWLTIHREPELPLFPERMLREATYDVGRFWWLLEWWPMILIWTLLAGRLAWLVYGDRMTATGQRDG